MNRPSGVRTAETMTTGSEVAAMTVILKQAEHSLNYVHHMMRRKNCNREFHEKMS
jgi:hypothetical protein